MSSGGSSPQGVRVDGLGKRLGWDRSALGPPIQHVDFPFLLLSSVWYPPLSWQGSLSVWCRGCLAAWDTGRILGSMASEPGFPPVLSIGPFPVAPGPSIPALFWGSVGWTPLLPLGLGVSLLGGGVSQSLPAPSFSFQNPMTAVPSRSFCLCGWAPPHPFTFTLFGSERLVFHQPCLTRSSTAYVLWHSKMH